MTKVRPPQLARLRVFPFSKTSSSTELSSDGSCLEGPSVDQLLSLVGERPGLCALDSSGGEPRRFSWVAFEPLDWLELGMEARGAFVQPLREFCGRWQFECTDSIPGPFQGGWMGALAYDLGVEGERPLDVLAEPWGLPLVAGGLYGRFFVRDEVSGQVWLCLAETDACDFDELKGLHTRLWHRWESGSVQGSQDHQGSGQVQAQGDRTRWTSSAEHMRRIESCRADIGRGELYQANLAHRFTQSVLGSPLALYRKLRQVNPAPYMGYLQPPHVVADGELSHSPRYALLSASPELFLEVEGTRCRTRPIKGTIAKGATEELDQRAREALLSSEKDRAELAMIVDLERNDLGRIAKPGAVWVEEFPRLESYPTLHHLSADVVAERADGLDVFDTIAALFPGGSITGAPKLASMDCIAELEGEGRGFFTGAFGFVDGCGTASLNILIRSLLWRPVQAAQVAEGGRVDRNDRSPVLGEVSFRVGGGITWSSSASDEDHETLVKAEGMFRALDTEVDTESK